MESRGSLSNLKLDYFVVFLTILTTSIFYGFHWETLLLIIPPTLREYISSRKDVSEVPSIALSSILGLTVFVLLPALLSIPVHTILGFHLSNYYAPKSIRPRVLSHRNLSAFILVSFAISKLLLFALKLDYSLLTFKNEAVTFFPLSFLSILSLSIIYQQSLRGYDELRATVADNEKSWTNNVMSLLSHNIRTPIASLGNRIDIIKMKRNSGIEISEDDVLGLTEDRDRVNSIVHGLLSKSSRNAISAKSTDYISVYHAIQEFEERAAISILDGIDFNLTANEKTALDLALESLVSNAEKYGASKIQITLEKRDQEAVVSVIDDGDGMDALSKERYGTPFNTSKSKNGGSGLGVYFALQLIKDAGWDWSLESELGKGTTVAISIPLQLLVQ